MSACLVPVRGAGFSAGAALPGLAAFALVLAFRLAGVAAPSALVVGAGASTASAPASAGVGPVSAAAGPVESLVSSAVSLSSGSTPMAAMPLLVMTTRWGRPAVSMIRTNPRLRRPASTFCSAPPLALTPSGKGSTERSSR